MNQQVLEKIKLLGLEEREARVYLSALEFGPTTIQKLSQKSGIKRTTIYEFIEGMISRGLITTTATGKRTLYGAPGVEGLERMIEKQRELVSELSPVIELMTKKVLPVRG